VQARRAITRHEEIRRRHGYSLTGLAHELGLSHAYLSRIETRRHGASAWYREAVAAVFAVAEETLFDADAKARVLAPEEVMPATAES
jgi:transcriptional regulator with XRE-family HTH domain